MSLLMHMIGSGRFTDKKILVVDRQEKNRNDRTWCFWEREAGMFEPVVAHRWQQISVQGRAEDEVTVMDIRPYTYKMIRGIDFYNWCLERIRSCSNICIRYGEVNRVSAGGIVFNGEVISAGWVFTSIRPPAKSQPGRYRLLQHFLGREIETADPVFTPGTATLMDFRVSQQPGTAFVYVMPFTTCRALVEYTIFSESLLPETEYIAALDEYITHRITAGVYKITETEFGNIPMSNERGPSGGNGLTYIGTAGGQTKPSSGYTFSFIQRQSARLVSDIVTNGYPKPERFSRRFMFYDSVLLNVLATGKLSGADVFYRLFRRNHPEDVLDFLGNESHWKQDWDILTSLPLIPFARAGLRELWLMRR